MMQRDIWTVRQRERQNQRKRKRECVCVCERERQQLRRGEMKLNGERKIEREQTRTQTGERKERIIYCVIHQNMRVPGSIFVLQKRNWMGDCVSLQAYVCMCVCMDVCMYICMYMCVCVCVGGGGQGLRTQYAFDLEKKYAFIDSHVSFVFCSYRRIPPLAWNGKEESY